MTKQLALDQLRRNGRTIDLHKRPLCTRRLVVHLTRHQLFARTVGPGDQHPGVCRRHRLHHGQDVLDGLRLAHDLMRLDGVGLFGQHLGGFNQSLTLKDVAQGDKHAVEVKRLLDEIVGALLQGLHRGLHRAVARNHDHGCGDVFLGQNVQDVEAIHLGHLDVTENGVESRFGRGNHTVHARSCLRHLVSFVLEDFFEAGADGRFVVDEEEVGHGDGVCPVLPKMVPNPAYPRAGSSGSPRSTLKSTPSRKA